MKVRSTGPVPAVAPDGAMQSSALALTERVSAAAAQPALASARLATVGLSVLVGLAVCWHVILEPGVIGFVHDWSIAPFAQQHLTLLRQTFDGWYRWGLGQPTAYSVEYPLRLALGFAAAFGAGGGLLSKLIVFLAPALSFATATYLARACRMPFAGAWIAGAFYALDPVMLNKLVSGQATYLFGYAFFPLVAAFFLRACERERPLLGGIALGGVLALAAMEVQLGLLALALLVLLVCFCTSTPLPRRLAIAATAFVTLALIEMPTFVWAAHGISWIVHLEQFGHGAAWLTANSLSPANAVRLIGYLARYDVLAVGRWIDVWQPASWVVVGVVAVGLFALRGPMRPTLLIATGVTLLVVCGTTTPLGPLITAWFARFPSAQLFRELYHVMVVPSLAYALGIGSAFVLAGRLRFAALARAGILVAMSIYVAPMLSGDVSGWLWAVPTDRYLERAFQAENAGPGRVLWLPMDQPLAFDDRGSGVDPMGVTERGSLWLYSLTWPLTAVDADVRSGDAAKVRRDTRALGVGAVVERDRLHSRYRGLPAVADAADRFFGSDVHFAAALGALQVESAGVRAYRIDGALPAVRKVARSAIVPRRFSVIADTMLDGAAAFGYGQELPRAAPYDVYYDGGDAAWEALQAAGLTSPKAEPRIDPFGGFAGGDLWWWYRPQYADAHSFSLAIGPGARPVVAPRALRDARLIVAWIATPAGGLLTVRCGGRLTVLDTGGTWQAWRSAVVACGFVPAGARVWLNATTSGAEVALRGAELVDSSAYGAAVQRLQTIARGARRRVALAPLVQGAPKIVRVGKGTALGSLAASTPAILELTRNDAAAASAVRVTTSNGYTLAWRAFPIGARKLSVPLLAANDMRLHCSDCAGAWRLLSLERRAGSIPGANAPAGSSGDVVVADETFDNGWRVQGARQHLVTALGTNAFVLAPGSAGGEAVSYAYTADYHVAYSVGILVLSIALAIGLGFVLHPGWRPVYRSGSRVAR